jgi:hypothetical protein
MEPSLSLLRRIAGFLRDRRTHVKSAITFQSASVASLSITAGESNGSDTDTQIMLQNPRMNSRLTSKYGDDTPDALANTIEDLMAFAQEAVTKLQLAFAPDGNRVFRTQTLASEATLQSVASAVLRLGLPSMDLSTPESCMRSLEALAQRLNALSPGSYGNEEATLRLALLRALGGAEYTTRAPEGSSGPNVHTAAEPRDGGAFFRDLMAIPTDGYFSSHFTSPARRYADLLTQRIVCGIVDEVRDPRNRSLAAAVTDTAARASASAAEQCTPTEAVVPEMASGADSFFDSLMTVGPGSVQEPVSHTGTGAEGDFAAMMLGETTAPAHVDAVVDSTDSFFADLIQTSVTSISTAPDVKTACSLGPNPGSMLAGTTASADNAGDLASASRTLGPHLQRMCLHLNTHTRAERALQKLVAARLLASFFVDRMDITQAVVTGMHEDYLKLFVPKYEVAIEVKLSMRMPMRAFGSQRRMRSGASTVTALPPALLHSSACIQSNGCSVSADSVVPPSLNAFLSRLPTSTVSELANEGALRLAMERTYPWIQTASEGDAKTGTGARASQMEVYLVEDTNCGQTDVDQCGDAAATSSDDRDATGDDLSSAYDPIHEPFHRCIYTFHLFDRLTVGLTAELTTRTGRFAEQTIDEPVLVGEIFAETATVRAMMQKGPIACTPLSNPIHGGTSSSEAKVADAAALPAPATSRRRRIPSPAPSSAEVAACGPASAPPVSTEVVTKGRVRFGGYKPPAHMDLFEEWVLGNAAGAEQYYRDGSAGEDYFWDGQGSEADEDAEELHAPTVDDYYYDLELAPGLRPQRPAVSEDPAWHRPSQWGASGATFARAARQGRVLSFGVKERQWHETAGGSASTLLGSEQELKDSERAARARMFKQGAERRHDRIDKQKRQEKK